ncbi:unnamed protein product [Leptidea sinapis]|uniref:Uncharacterized protein n=1 Tax=Leptidea sinapis TaxID=189913 RepID=A0A5E4PW45_9NEOP|nr:unnamed protein product [Leptidea sinapis]
MDARQQVKMTLLVCSMGALVGYSFGLFPRGDSTIPQNKPKVIQTGYRSNDDGTFQNIEYSNTFEKTN